MKFRLLGQDVAISEAAECYNTYRKLFIGQAKTAANQFFDMYERNQPRTFLLTDWQSSSTGDMTVRE